MRKSLFVAALAGLSILAAGASWAGELDSTAWRIHEKGETETEDLIFIDGRFTSSGCIPYGFISSDYSSSKDGGNVKWQATQTNKDMEKMAWTGQTKGKEINGTYVFTDKKGKSYTSIWTGKMLEAK